MVLADPLITKVVSNLIDNTIRHGKKAHNICFSISKNDRVLTFVYEDDGEGIPSEDKISIFEKGFGKNTGLGLFLSKEILGITKMTIEESGIPGKGAKFVIEIPSGMYEVRETTK